MLNKQKVMMNKIAVVILNWNGKPFLERFLGDIVRFSSIDGINTVNSVGDSCAGGARVERVERVERMARMARMVEVVVADNGSTDGSLEFLAENFRDDVRVIRLDQNYGFTGGYNRALRQVEATYYLLLNSDIQVTPGYLEPLFSLLERDSSVAAAMPKIRSFDEPEKFEYAGASGGFIDTLGYPFCRGRLISQTEVDRGQYDSEREIFWATGAAFFVRSSDYWAAGGLDELFFAHMEEIDLCWRLKRMGRKIMVVPQSVVYHVGGGTLPVWSPRKTYLNFRNNIAMLYKNLTGVQFAAVWGVRMGTDSLRALSYLASGKFDFMAAIFRGHRDFWRMRRQLDRQRELPVRRVGQIYRFSIVLRYLFNKNFDEII